MIEVTAHRISDLRVSLQARQHEVISDAQVGDGGTDQGPTPHELLAASLAGCTTMTVQMYANRKGWPLKSCDITIRMPENEPKDPDVPTQFDLTISFDGDLSHEQREKLTEIAHRCPVHRALKKPIGIKITAV